MDAYIDEIIGRLLSIFDCRLNCVGLGKSLVTVGMVQGVSLPIAERS